MTLFLVKNLSATVPAGLQTHWKMKVSLCSEYRHLNRPRVAPDHVPNKLTNLHNRNTCETPLLLTEKDVRGLQHLRTPRNSTSHRVGYADSESRLGLGGLHRLRKQAGNRGTMQTQNRLGLGVSSRNGERTEARNNAAGVKQEQRRAADGIRTEMPFGKCFSGEDAHLALAVTPV